MVKLLIITLKLLKNYHSYNFFNTYFLYRTHVKFKHSLVKNPFQGVDLGGKIRKLRMTISSKGKGKSGGARIITFNIIQHEDESVEITLLTIYDKNEISNVNDKYMKWLISLLNG